MEQTKKIPHDPSKPALVIALASPKGGPGKTTLAVAISAELARRAEGPVALVDLDSTANAISHVSLRKGEEDGFPVVAENLAPVVNQTNVLAANLNAYKKSSQFLVIDTPGAIENSGAQFALTAADIVITPMKPAVYDSTATKQCLEVLQRIAMVRSAIGGQKHFVVINCPERTAIGQQAQVQAAIMAEEFGAHLCDVRVRKRVVYDESAATGLPLWLLGSGAKDAVQDIERLVDEVLQQYGCA